MWAAAGSNRGTRQFEMTRGVRAEAKYALEHFLLMAVPQTEVTNSVRRANFARQANTNGPMVNAAAGQQPARTLGDTTTSAASSMGGSRSNSKNSRSTAESRSNNDTAAQQQRHRRRKRNFLNVVADDEDFRHRSFHRESLASSKRRRISDSDCSNGSGDDKDDTNPSRDNKKAKANAVAVAPPPLPQKRVVHHKPNNRQPTITIESPQTSPESTLCSSVADVEKLVEALPPPPLSTTPINASTSTTTKRPKRSFLDEIIVVTQFSGPDAPVTDAADTAARGTVTTGCVDVAMVEPAPFARPLSSLIMSPPRYRQRPPLRPSPRHFLSGVGARTAMVAAAKQAQAQASAVATAAASDEGAINATAGATAKEPIALLDDNTSSDDSMELDTESVDTVPPPLATSNTTGPTNRNTQTTMPRHVPPRRRLHGKTRSTSNSTIVYRCNKRQLPPKQRRNQKEARIFIGDDHQATLVACAPLSTYQSTRSQPAKVWDATLYALAAARPGSLVEAYLGKSRSSSVSQRLLDALHCNDYNVKEAMCDIVNSTVPTKQLWPQPATEWTAEQVTQFESHCRQFHDDEITLAQFADALECDKEAVLDRYHLWELTLKSQTTTMAPRTKRRQSRQPLQSSLDSEDESDLCVVCQEPGTLLCCDSCPQGYHLACLDLAAVPDGDWYGPCCRNGPSNQFQLLRPRRCRQNSLVEKGPTTTTQKRQTTNRVAIALVARRAREAALLRAARVSTVAEVAKTNVQRKEQSPSTEPVATNTEPTIAHGAKRAQKAAPSAPHGMVWDAARCFWVPKVADLPLPAGNPSSNATSSHQREDSIVVAGPGTKSSSSASPKSSTQQTVASRDEANRDRDPAAGHHRSQSRPESTHGNADKDDSSVASNNSSDNNEDDDSSYDEESQGDSNDDNLSCDRAGAANNGSTVNPMPTAAALPRPVLPSPPKNINIRTEPAPTTTALVQAAMPKPTSSTIVATAKAATQRSHIAPTKTTATVPAQTHRGKSWDSLLASYVAGQSIPQEQSAHSGNASTSLPTFYNAAQPIQRGQNAFASLPTFYNAGQPIQAGHSTHNGNAFTNLPTQAEQLIQTRQTIHNGSAFGSLPTYNNAGQPIQAGQSSHNGNALASLPTYSNAGQPTHRGKSIACLREYFNERQSIPKAKSHDVAGQSAPNVAIATQAVQVNLPPWPSSPTGMPARTGNATVQPVARTGKSLDRVREYYDARQERQQSSSVTGAAEDRPGESTLDFSFQSDFLRCYGSSTAVPLSTLASLIKNHGITSWDAFLAANVSLLATDLSRLLGVTYDMALDFIGAVRTFVRQQLQSKTSRIATSRSPI